MCPGVSPGLPGDLTDLLQAWRGGDSEAGARLIEEIYPRLRVLAGQQLRRNPMNVSLQPTEVVNELYLKLSKGCPDSPNRIHFFAIASRLIREILIDHVRTRQRKKRGGGAVTLALDDVEGFATAGRAPSVDLLALDQALVRLAEIDEKAVRLVELRYFGGLEIEEAVPLLGLSRPTLVRKWRYARAWLRRTLEEPAVP